MRNKSLLLLAFLLVVLAGCSKDEEVKLTNVEHLVSPIDKDRNFTQVWGKNETLSLKCSVKSSTTGLSVKTFDVYLNDNLIASSSGKKECVVNYPLSEVDEGLSELKIVTKTNASGYDESVHTSRLMLWINDVKPVTSIEMDCPSTVTIGETVTAKFNFSTNIKNSKNPIVSVYWDSKLLASSSSSPYEVMFKVADQNKGIHEVIGMVAWNIEGFGQVLHLTDKLYVTVN